MWNKRDEEPLGTGRPAGPAPSPQVAETRHEPDRSTNGTAAIGPSITIVGELSGDEDLTILGKVEGTIQLPKHSVTIGCTAKVTADIRAKAVSVEAEVRGNLQAAEQILSRKTATMLGNRAAPRVGLEDGCRFKGSVDMESSGTTTARPAYTTGKAPEPILRPVAAPADRAPVKNEPMAARTS